MDADLHRKLADYVHERRFGSDKTSIDAVVQDAIRIFLSGGSAQSPQVEGEFIKCPKHLIPVVHRVINMLMEPGEYEALLAEGAMEALKRGLQVVPPKKKTN